MTVLTQVAPVDAPELDVSEMTYEELVDATKNQDDSQTSTGKISSNISIKDTESYTTWKLEENVGFQVIKFDVYDFRAVKNMDKKIGGRRTVYGQLFVRLLQ